MYEEHHEPLISRDTYDKAQSIGVRQGVIRQSEPNLFRGKVVCGFCGSAVCDFRNHKERFYMCARKRRYGAKNSGCQSNSISKKYFCDTVFRAIQDMIRLFLDEDAVIKAFNRSEKGKSRRRILQESVNKASAEINKAQENKGALYADYREGLLDEAEYLSLNREFSEKIEELTAKLEEAVAYLKRFDHTPMSDDALKKAISGFKRKRKLTQEMVDVFIDKITIYEGRRMEIRFVFDDEMKVVLAKREEREADQ